MTTEQFDEIIKGVLDYLYNDCQAHPDNYKKSGEVFEPFVKDAIEHALQDLDIQAKIDYTPGGHGFPDIVIEDDFGNKYGVEVKSSDRKGKSWKINGNSVLGSTRVPGICKNMIVFGKLRGADSLFRAREYEKSIVNVAVTHSPRYLIDLDVPDGESFFDKSHLQYSDISKSDEPIKIITDYFRSQGQTAWWLAESTPAAIQMFGDLLDEQKDQLCGYAFVHYPEIFSNSKTKFNRFVSWLALENSIIDSSLRDRFTAGGQVDVELEAVIYSKLPHIFTTLHDCRHYVLNELQEADLDILGEDWGQSPQDDFEGRVRQWISLVNDALPNKGLEHVHKEQMLEDIIFD